MRSRAFFSVFCVVLINYLTLVYYPGVFFGASDTDFYGYLGIKKPPVVGGRLGGLFGLITIIFYQVDRAICERYALISCITHY